MRTEIKAIRSKPLVSLTRAVGTLILKADDLADAAILTALASMLLHGTHAALKETLSDAAMQELNRMREGQGFEMILPKPKRS